MIPTSENGYIDSMRKVLKESYQRIHIHKPIKITGAIEKKIVDIATKNPRKLWTTLLNMVFTGTGRICISKELNLVNSISHTQIRNILVKQGIRHRQSKITIGNSTDPEYHLKKRELKI